MKVDDKRCYIYIHRKETNLEIFYVGKGTVYKEHVKSSLIKRFYHRAFSSSNRNKMWKKIKNKHGYTVEIVKDNLSEECADELEIFLISEIGRRDENKGSLSNLTDGGEGMLGCKPSKEARKKMSEYHKNKKLTEDHKNNIRKSFIGLRKGDKHPLYGVKGEKHHNFGKILSKEHKNKISSSRILNKSGRYGKNPRAKKVIDTETDEIFECGKILAEKLNIKYPTFSSMLCGNTPNVTKYMYLDDFKKKGKLEKGQHKRKPKIKLKNIKNNVVYDSVSDASKALNYVYGTLYHNIVKKGFYKDVSIL